jgi:hypothetical protein
MGNRVVRRAAYVDLDEFTVSEQDEFTVSEQPVDMVCVPSTMT